MMLLNSRIKKKSGKQHPKFSLKGLQSAKSSHMLHNVLISKGQYDFLQENDSEAKIIYFMWRTKRL